MPIFNWLSRFFEPSKCSSNFWILSRRSYPSVRHCTSTDRRAAYPNSSAKLRLCLQVFWTKSPCLEHLGKFSIVASFAETNDLFFTHGSCHTHGLAPCHPSLNSNEPFSMAASSSRSAFEYPPLSCFKPAASWSRATSNRLNSAASPSPKWPGSLRSFKLCRRPSL